jgi:hypothetical protein
MKTLLGFPLLSCIYVLFACSLPMFGQTAMLGKTQTIQPILSAQSTSAPVPDPGLQFSVWQQTSQSTTTSADGETQFKMWQSQRTSADSINLFKCTTSTDLDNPECVGKLPATSVTGTKEAKIPTTRPVRKSKTGEPD